jgi:hypothetical protein
MTEAEWLNTANPTILLRAFEGKLSERKGRLFATACSRQIWQLLSDEVFRTAVEVAEKYADGAASEDERRAAFEGVIAAAGGTNELAGYFSGLNLSAPQLVVALAIRTANETLSDDTGRFLACEALATSDSMFRLLQASRQAVHSHILSDRANSGGAFQRLWQSVRAKLRDVRTAFSGRYSAAQEQALSEAERQRGSMAKDIFGNPFRPVIFSPAWRTDTALSLARQMYESREFSAMPILADALQDAGCDNEDILTHCRDDNAAHVRGCWVVDLVSGKE